MSWQVFLKGKNKRNMVSSECGKLQEDLHQLEELESTAIVALCVSRPQTF